MVIMYSQVFDLVEWEMIYQKLWNMPKMFQLWACKQVMGIMGTMEWDRTVIQKCPSFACKSVIPAHTFFFAIILAGWRLSSIPLI